MTVRTVRGQSSVRRAALLLLTAAVALGACGGSAHSASKAPLDTSPPSGPSTAVAAPDTSPTSTPLVALAPAPPTTAPPTTVATTAPPETSPPTQPPTTEAPAPATTAAPQLASVAAAPAAPQAPFVFEVSAIGADTQARMVPSSWRPGCPVPLEELRYLRVSYWGFDDAAHVGELVVNASATEAMRAVFSRLYGGRFPIRQMRLVDDYGGDDSASIEADNTSAFNCRQATGSTNWSQHALGLAIDVNPIENPYVYGDGTTDHPASVPYLDRSVVRSGMAVEGGPLVAAFDSVSWGWGGRWASPIDYQHFSANGR